MEVKRDSETYSASSLDPSPASTGAGSDLRWGKIKDSFRRAEPQSSNTRQDDLEASKEGPALTKGLRKRQLQMISLGGCVGSGLLVASGKALRNGPGAVLVAWAIVSTFLYCTMQLLAEVVAVFPVLGSFATHASHFIDPSWGFAMGWNYTIFWLVVLPLELVASSITIGFWGLNINPVAWVSIFYVLIIALNLAGNRGFGETEFVASIIKLLGVVGFDILAIILICGGGDEGYIGGKNWLNPGSFVTGGKGVMSVLITATYSLAGTELVGLTASESHEDPRKALPDAIKQVFWRIIIFYMLTLTLIGFLVPANSKELLSGGPGALASPFVIAIRAGGIKVLPTIFNVVVLVALLAIGNSAVYGSSRTVLALSQQGLAPKFLSYVDRSGRPLAGIILAAIIGLLAFVLALPKQAAVFDWLVSLSGLLTLFTWGSINASHIQFRRAYKYHGHSLEELPYVANTGVWGAYYGLIMNIAVLGLQFWLAVWPLGAEPSAVAFFQNYLGFVIVLVFWIGHKIWKRNWRFLNDISTIDVNNGRTPQQIADLMAEKAQEKAEMQAKPLYKRIYHMWC